MCRLPAHTAFERVKRLLSSEGVTYTVADLSLRSTRTPIGLRFQPTGYTRKNWVGINPFACVSGVEARCEPKDINTTVVTVDVDRRRAFLWVAYWFACSLLVASALPQPVGALLLFAVSCAAWFGYMELLGSYLIKMEIGDELEARASRESSA